MYLVPSDLLPFATIDAAKAAAMIEDAEAMAALAAPCITEASFQIDVALSAAVKAVLRGAVLRWHEAGSGVVQQQTAGPFGQTVDTRMERRSMFWPSEIAQLRDLCSQFVGRTKGQKAFSITPTGSGSAHVPWCSLSLGAAYCSCGVDIAGVPIFEAPL